MLLGKRGPDEKQEPIWIEAARLATPAGDPFYERLNRLLSKRGFDVFAESACESFYAKAQSSAALPLAKPNPLFCEWRCQTDSVAEPARIAGN
jgi:hypothetical protein